MVEQRDEPIARAFGLQEDSDLGLIQTILFTMINHQVMLAPFQKLHLPANCTRNLVPFAVHKSPAKLEQKHRRDKQRFCLKKKKEKQSAKMTGPRKV